ncbi:hypothetical protein LP414_10030 [Polaromonas sp. P1(28)-13]|nr:hypothetical protein LP417_20645 [Polaromonas sp. P1-6]UUZ77490.1 hypothetical protein LP414_10030 [Polaromonas sp. P1(28)-13]
MNDAQLDHLYSALAQAIGRAGEARAPLFLATLALALLSHEADADKALAQIAQAERLTNT